MRVRPKCEEKVPSPRVPDCLPGHPVVWGGVDQDQERDWGGGIAVVFIQQELKLLQVDHCHIGRVQVDSLEFLGGN